MVIDTSLEKLDPLIPKSKTDEMSKVTADYESFMYYCNLLSNLITDSSLSPNNLILDLPIIHSHLDSLKGFANNIQLNIQIALKGNKEYMEKIKLIAFNITNQIVEVILKFNKMKQNLKEEHSNEEISTINYKIEEIHNLTKEINRAVNKQILESSEIYIKDHKQGNNKRRIDNHSIDEQNEVGNFITAVCIGMFVIFIGVVSYLKVTSE